MEKVIIKVIQYLICIILGIFIGFTINAFPNKTFKYYTFSGDNYIDSLITVVANEYNIDVFEFAGLIQLESNFNVMAKGKKGEIGLGQFLYYKEFLYRPDINLRLSAAILNNWKIKYPTKYTHAYNVGNALNVKNGYDVKVKKYSKELRIKNGLLK